MMGPKPLSKEDRDHITEMVECWHPRSNARVLVEKALAAEAFWREAVKNGPEFDNEMRNCLWCGVVVARAVHGTECEPHAPDCEWLLAQE